MKNPTTASCVFCCSDVEASAAATAWVRHKFNKNLGEPIKGIGKRCCCKNRRARRCWKTLLVIDMRLAGNEVPQPAQRTGDVEKGPFRMVRLFAEQGLGVALLAVVGIKVALEMAIGLGGTWQQRRRWR